jgi:hypothetical protein
MLLLATSPVHDETQIPLFLVWLNDFTRNSIAAAQDFDQTIKSCRFAIGQSW